MWLLDHNVPRKIKEVLARYGINARTAVEAGWDILENGALLSEVEGHKYEVILTRDRRFQIAAMGKMKTHESITIVLLKIPQSDSKSYCAAFEKAWKQSPISLKSGNLVE